ncbi:hypothetical protein KCP74_11270 [Salmonella enterica subsp. enterica]|nr:hypothetical protein KCP74_11270 [Salmonella enterica subsp. enterica]
MKNWPSISVDDRHHYPAKKRVILKNAGNRHPHLWRRGKLNKEESGSAYYHKTLINTHKKRRIRSRCEIYP